MTTLPVITATQAAEALANPDNVIVSVRGEAQVMTFVEYYETFDAIMLANRSDMHFYRTHYYSADTVADAMNRMIRLNQGKRK